MSNQTEPEVGYLVGNYRLWKKEIERLEHVLFGNSFTMGSWGVAQYGIDAAMPRGSSIRSAKGELIWVNMLHTIIKIIQ